MERVIWSVVAALGPDGRCTGARAYDVARRELRRAGLPTVSRSTFGRHWNAVASATRSPLATRVDVPGSRATVFPVDAGPSTARSREGPAARSAALVRRPAVVRPRRPGTDGTGGPEPGASPLDREFSVCCVRQVARDGIRLNGLAYRSRELEDLRLVGPVLVWADPADLAAIVVEVSSGDLLAVARLVDVA